MTTPETPFIPAPKTPRLSRECVITEKIDGCRSTIFIDDSGELFCGSRNRWITPEQDNYGFARWCEERREELLKLGPGRHDGEFWGAGIQRRYGLAEKRFSLFNASRWHADSINGGVFELTVDAATQASTAGPGPRCCSVVPTLYFGDFNTHNIREVLEHLQRTGSVAAPGFMDPEGIVIYHTAAKMCFKKTIKDDASPKSLI